MGYPSSMNAKESSISPAPHENKNRELRMSDDASSREFKKCRFGNFQWLKTTLVVVVVVVVDSQSDWPSFFMEGKLSMILESLELARIFLPLLKKR